MVQPHYPGVGESFVDIIKDLFRFFIPLLHGKKLFAVKFMFDTSQILSLFLKLEIL